ncbi:MAG: hypothetical protein SFT94_00370 [Pseudanabaenaceae cyanobacterium bins.68]|nr:hypothetical protein [Pseudanabaenaceae cyanobacterium bins.68]
MHLPPLQIPSFTEQVILGEVRIDPTVAIAPGVILQADPDCKVLIEAGVVIGMGVIIHARGGDLEIGAGCNLGAGVLMVGQGRIGINCCVGACSTIVNPSLEPEQVVAPGSLLADLQDSQPVASEPPAKIAVTHAKAHLRQFRARSQLN